MSQNPNFWKKIWSAASHLGTLSFVFAVADIVVNINSLEQLYLYINNHINILINFLDWISQIIHAILAPWNWFTDFIFRYIPVNIPEYLHSPLVLLFLFLGPVLERINFPGQSTPKKWLDREKKIFDSIERANQIISSERELQEKTEELHYLIRDSGLMIYVVLHGPILNYYKRAKSLLTISDIDPENDESLNEYKTQTTLLAENFHSSFDNYRESEISKGEKKSKPLTFGERRKIKIIFFLTILIILDYWVFESYEKASLFFGGLILSFIVTIFFFLLFGIVMLLLGILSVVLFWRLGYLVMPRVTEKHLIKFTNQRIKSYLGEKWLEERGLDSSLLNSMRNKGEEYLNEFILSSTKPLDPKVKKIRKVVKGFLRRNE